MTRDTPERGGATAYVVHLGERAGHLELVDGEPGVAFVPADTSNARATRPPDTPREPRVSGA